MPGTRLHGHMLPSLLNIFCELAFVISSTFQVRTLWSVLQTFPKEKARGADILSQTVGFDIYV